MEPGDLLPGISPPGRAALVRGLRARDFAKGAPVVAKGQARIRVQISAAHEPHHLDKAIQAFTETGKELGVLK